MECLRFKKAVLATLLSLFIMKAFADNKSQSPPEVGFFTLPASQQPGPFFSFGQNLIGAKKAQFYAIPTYLKIQNGHYGDVLSTLLYGITDEASILFNVPVSVSDTVLDQHATGFQDIFLQGEYGFYTSSNARYQDQATVVGAISLPSGSPNKNPMTGIGTTGIFVGGTFNRMYTEWMGFVSGFAYFPGKNEDLFREGSSYYYQAGLGHVITTIPKKFIFSWLVEIDGQYMMKNKTAGVVDPDTGGNVVLLVPSIWFSSRNFIGQFGVGFPILQHLNGNQGKDRYLLAASLGWTLN